MLSFAFLSVHILCFPIIIVIPCPEILISFLSTYKYLTLNSNKRYKGSNNIKSLRRIGNINKNESQMNEKNELKIFEVSPEYTCFRYNLFASEANNSCQKFLRHNYFATLCTREEIVRIKSLVHSRKEQKGSNNFPCHFQLLL